MRKYFNLNLTGEQSVKAWVLRALTGPAGILDGLISTLTLGIISSNFELHSVFALAYARLDAEKAISKQKSEARSDQS